MDGGGHVSKAGHRDDISARLHVSVATVKTHVGAVLTKTGSRDRTQAVVTAYRAGVATIG